MQAVTHMASRVGVPWIVAPFAFLLSLSIAGIGSAWLGGSARIPFVAGLDSYMPRWLGSIHSKYRTPYAALSVHAGVSLIAGADEFLARRSAGSFSALAFAGGRIAVDSVSLYVCCVAENGAGAGFSAGTVQQGDADFCRERAGW